MDNEVLFCLQHSGPNNVLLRGETPLLGITNFSSMLRLRNGKSATGGRRTSETRELTTAVNAVAIHLQDGTSFWIYKTPASHAGTSDRLKVLNSVACLRLCTGLSRFCLCDDGEGDGSDDDEHMVLVGVVAVLSHVH
jgi:hypothetical protein